MTAEGGGEFGYDDPTLDHNIDHDDDDDEEEVNRTQPFQPGATSTPYHGGEQHEMQTMMDEQSGLPDTSYVQTPLLDDLTDVEAKKYHVGKALDYIKKMFPNVDFKKLGPIGFGKKQSTQGNIVSYGPQGGETPIFKKNGSGFLKSVTDKFKNTLGPSAEQIIAEDRDIIQEQRQRLAEAEKQEQEAQKIAAEREKELQDIENLKQQTEKIGERIAVIEEEHGSNVESEAELQRLKQLKKNHQTELEKKEKELASLEKQVKKNKGVKEKVSRESAKLDEIVKKRNQTEERLNSTKTLTELKSDETELRQQNVKDQAIINATETSHSDRQAAEARVQERNEELGRLQPQIAEREEAMPLRERIKEIFKKHGVTVTAIFIAAGVTIGAVVSSITKGLKATGKAMAGGLEEIGAKLGSLLPGLIGQVASFLFNTAAKAVGFLAEHTWLIILAVVAFLFEKYIKRRR